MKRKMGVVGVVLLVTGVTLVRAECSDYAVSECTVSNNNTCTFIVVVNKVRRAKNCENKIVNKIPFALSKGNGSLQHKLMVS